MKNQIRAVKVGVMPLDAFKKRTIAIAKGEYKSKADEPKIWFTSMKSLAHVLSEENQALLKLIAEIEPQSIKALEDATGRKSNNILRTLRKMEHYGFVKLLKGVQGRGRAALIPKVSYNCIQIALNFI
jgi:predicted transcriptional regulator